MAFWVVGGGSSLEGVGPATLFEGGNIKRSPSGLDFDDDSGYSGFSKRIRLNDWGEAINGPEPLPRDSIQVKNLAFLVIRERSPTPEPLPPPTNTNTTTTTTATTTITTITTATSHISRRLLNPLERTESGLSISSSSEDTKHDDSLHDDREGMLSDLEAARIVKKHVGSYRRRNPDSRNQRILKTLINPRSREADFPLDNDALRSIFSAANELFFANRLSQRVAWDWSHSASAQYESHIVGTTALRKSARLGGYETLIVLSSPILRDTKYNRRLLIATFLHEMIHSYLFVTTGLKAQEGGGHTEGFRQIAETIDEWVGKDSLRLSNMDADLEHFRDACSTSSYLATATSTTTATTCSSSSWPPSAWGDREHGARGGCSEHTREAYQEHRQSRYDDDMSNAPVPIRNAERNGWQWYEQEGFRTEDRRRD